MHRGFFSFHLITLNRGKNILCLVSLKQKCCIPNSPAVLQVVLQILIRLKVILHCIQHAIIQERNLETEYRDAVFLRSRELSHRIAHILQQTLTAEELRLGINAKGFWHDCVQCTIHNFLHCF